MNKSPAFQWYPKDILASARVQEMSLAEEGAYRRLLDFCWLNGSIPADEKRVSRLIGKGATVEIAQVCMEMFVPDPQDESRLIHDRLEEERAKQEQNSIARQNAANARWSKRGTSENGNGKQVNTDRTANAKQSKSKSNAKAMQMQCSSSATSTSSSNFNTSGSGNSYAHARGEPPTAAGNVQTKRQWEELTDEEKVMSKKDFAAHLQALHPGKDVRAVSRRLKKWCADNNKTFVRERLKGWLSGEGETLDDEFLEALGEGPPDVPHWQKAMNDCRLCDEKGLVDVGGKIKVCSHEETKK